VVRIDHVFRRPSLDWAKVRSLELNASQTAKLYLDDAKARKIAAEVGKAVSTWRQEAARHDLTKGEIDRMASAFEHEDLELAGGRAGKRKRATE
jgi:hypothetical protein